MLNLQLNLRYLAVLLAPVLPWGRRRLSRSAHSPFQAEAPAAVGLNAEVQGKQSCLFQVPSPVCIAYGVWPHFCSIIISLVIVDC